MSLFISSLNTGSNGNCFYIGNGNEAVLIDVGLTCKETELRMQRLNLSMNQVKAIFISHEHSDHIRGLPVIAKKYQLPVYITPSTLVCGKQQLPLHLLHEFKAYSPVQIGDLKIIAFPKKHDAVEPHSFTVSCKGTKVGVFTDIGQHCEHVIDNFKQCHAVFLEANYDDKMLDLGRYPYFLKNRIRGGNGHLSNSQALALFTSHKSANLSHLFLSHLSKDNNCPDLVQRLFNANSCGTEIIVASRLQETPVYHIVNQVTNLVSL
ncbi:MBL fold metallo-hydrolase [Pedobacter insulae]|uniref:Phosphoribosyl 1,2-cyclic phosphodiesterase n=1 Tax=Pedobacter insulae TaxID=414048 RepID=A0A1I2WNN7_9SPHI|nr:MBL fold metallo-hydrolase [Pedobacter insulae]SFH01976.1 Phosphoribosyl 1,2-cyclic phosphodiesterase [Pedobacter insulae]